METRVQDAGGAAPATPANKPARRKKHTQEDGSLRFFLPKPGSSPARPELGQEMTSEGEALIEALKSGQPFYTLAAWKAVPEVNGGGSPVIVKQALART
jgi:hypothetical protein